MTHKHNHKRSGLMLAIAAVIMVVVMPPAVSAVPPMPEVVAKWQSEGVWQQKQATYKSLMEAGHGSVVSSPMSSSSHKLSTGTADSARLLVILVDFSDNQWQTGSAGGPADFDSILFSDSRDSFPINPTGSMTDYYRENSYGQFNLTGEVRGWYRMPQTYEWYTYYDNGASRSKYLAGHAVLAARADGVDFSEFDADNDGNIDGLVVIHAGQGAESTGRGIWSHKSKLYPAEYFDGVTILDYVMTPEEYRRTLSPIGVVCHEYGHVLGLPDLYDIDLQPSSSDGLGRWSLMATGCYNGDARLPAHLDAWSKAELGFITLIDVFDNTFQSEIPAVNFNPVAYRLSNQQSGSNEYWIVENRQRVGFDSELPGDGLCIYHVDLDAPAANIDHTRYRVALEQADGNNDLAMVRGNKGDAADTWPGSSDAREFADITTPNTRTNDGSPTEIGVWDISDSDSLMYANFDLSYSRPWPVLAGSDSVFFDDYEGGDGDGYLEPGETVYLYVRAASCMRQMYNARVSLHSDRDDIEYLANNVRFGYVLDATARRSADPVIFVMPDSLDPQIDSFYVTIEGDSTGSETGSINFVATIGIEVVLGAPQVLLVDDDRGASWEVSYQDAISSLRISYSTWCVELDGVPSGDDLARYPHVFWFTGDSTEGAIDEKRVTSLKSYLDNGGNLLLSTASGVWDLNENDPEFLRDYLHTELDGVAHFPLINGSNSNSIGTSTTYLYQQWVPFTHQSVLAPIDGGEAVLLIKDQVCAVSHEGSNRTVLIAFPIEYIDDNRYDSKQVLISRVLDFFGGISPTVYDGQPFVRIPKSFELAQNYPNPFNPSTTISYDLQETGSAANRTELAIFNMLGQKVVTLVDDYQTPGIYEVVWDGTNTGGSRVASGVYLYRLTSGNEVQTKKMLLLK